MHDFGSDDEDIENLIAAMEAEEQATRDTDINFEKDSGIARPGTSKSFGMSSLSCSNGSQDKSAELAEELKNTQAELERIKAELAIAKSKESASVKVELTRSALAKSGRTARLLDTIPGASELKNRTISGKEKSALFEQLNKEQSSLHKGDTSSSEDEDQRNPMEEKYYSEYGRDMKRRIAHQAKADSVMVTNKKLEVLKKRAVESSEDLLIDFYSGLRISNPIVTKSKMTEYMQGRKMIRMSTIELHMKNGKIAGDFVTIGVLLSKSDPRTSQKGNRFSVWYMSDLKDTTKSVSLYLFGAAVQELWKTPVGTVAGLLNPSFMDKGSRDYISLSIHHPQRLLVMGTSKDLAKCKAKTKSGESCRMFVNRAECEYCTFHVQKEYKKASSKRGALQTFTGAQPKALMAKLFGNKQQSIAFSGKVVTLPGIKKNEVKSKLGSAKGRGKCLPHLTEKEVDVLSDLKDKQLREHLKMPSAGAQNLLKHLVKEDDEKKVANKEIVSVTVQDLLKQHEHKLKEKSHTPVLGRGLKAGEDVVLSQVPSKAKAVNIIRSKGGINKENPNAVKKKSKVKEKVAKKSEAEKETSVEVNDGLLKINSPLGTLNLTKEELQKLIDAKSAHTDLLEEHDNEQREKYFHSLEKKEEMEEKMAGIMEVPVTVVKCHICKYRALYPSDHCKEMKHTLKRAKGVKRFFSCKNCHRRTISIDRIPTQPCSNCGSENWERAPMRKERKGPKLDSEILSVRGDEIANLNSLSTSNIYLNM